MKELINMGMSEGTLKCMFEMNPYLADLTQKEFEEKLNILRKIDCSDSQIVNIVGSNSLFFDRSTKNVIELFNFLNQLGFTMLNLLIDSNPFILNLDVDEVRMYILNRINGGEDIDYIVDDLDSNPYLFNEI